MRASPSQRSLVAGKPLSSQNGLTTNFVSLPLHPLLPAPPAAPDRPNVARTIIGEGSGRAYHQKRSHYGRTFLGVIRTTILRNALLMHEASRLSWMAKRSEDRARQAQTTRSYKALNKHNASALKQRGSMRGWSLRWKRPRS